MKVLLFDLYDTILKDISFDFHAGLVYLYNAYFSKNCSFNELTEYAETFLPLYERRKTENIEICLIQDEIPFFFERFGVPLPENLYDLEYNIMDHMQKVTLLDDVRVFLSKAANDGIPMYILSNSIFTGTSAKKLLNEFGILRYFTNVFSSADCRIRKPSTQFFQIAIDEIQNDFSDTGKEDILYVGNDSYTDVIGGLDAGLNTIWYNVEPFHTQSKVKVKEMDCFKDLFEILCT